MGEIHLRYYIKLKNGEHIVIHTDNTDHESIFVQSSNENKFICLPRTIINKDDIAYIKIDEVTDKQKDNLVYLNKKELVLSKKDTLEFLNNIKIPKENFNDLEKRKLLLKDLMNEHDNEKE